MRIIFALLLVAQLAAAQGRGAGAAAATGASAERAASIRENYTKFEYRIPMRDGVKLFTSVYVPKDVFTDGKTYPIMMQRTGYNVAPVRHRSVPRDPRPLGAVRAGEVHLRLPGRARPVHERRRLRHHPPAQARQERAQGHRREHRHLRHHRLAGQKRPRQHRQGGHVGHLAAGLLRHGGHDRRASGAGGGVAAGARHRLLHGRRRLPQRRVHAGAPLQLLHGLPQSRGRPRAAPAHAAVRLRHARRLRLLSQTWARSPTPTKSTSSTSSPSGT